ncbi:MAG: molybdate ABC transporter substrate-binding protein [Halioglobus sp.]
MIRALTLLLLLHCVSASAGEPLRIAVAANFRGTLEQINQRYQQQSDQQILLSSASTGVLASQVSYGAPFDLFFSADSETPKKLLATGTGVSSACYALGQMSLVGGDFLALQNSDLTLAIANPKTAPYGRAAMEILSRPELNLADRGNLVRGTNVLQAFGFWRAGAADLALVARSLAPEGQPIQPDWHQPLQQDLLVLQQSPALTAYLQWLGSDTVRQMIIDAGYLPCP